MTLSFAFSWRIFLEISKKFLINFLEISFVHNFFYTTFFIMSLSHHQFALALSNLEQKGLLTCDANHALHTSFKLLNIPLPTGISLNHGQKRKHEHEQPQIPKVSATFPTADLRPRPVGTPTFGQLLFKEFVEVVKDNTPEGTDTFHKRQKAFSDFRNEVLAAKRANKAYSMVYGFDKHMKAALGEHEVKRLYTITRYQLKKRLQSPERKQVTFSKSPAVSDHECAVSALVQLATPR